MSNNQVLAMCVLLVAALPLGLCGLDTCGRTRRGFFIAAAICAAPAVMALFVTAVAG